MKHSGMRFGIFLAAVFLLGACSKTTGSTSNQGLSYGERYIDKNRLYYAEENRIYYLFRADQTGDYRYYSEFDPALIEDYTISFRWAWMGEAMVNCFYNGATFGPKHAGNGPSNRWVSQLNVSRECVSQHSSPSFAFEMFIAESYLATLPMGSISSSAK